MDTYENFNAPAGSEMRAARSDRPVNGYAHIYSDGTNVSSLFRSREDFIYGMNAMAITAYSCGISILTMQLMETHFHLIARGKLQDCSALAGKIAVKMQAYLTKTGRRFAVKGQLKVCSDPISAETELKSKFIYVYRNAISAGFQIVPWRYEWGAGDIYFVDHGRMAHEGKRIDEFPVLARRSMFHTGFDLPKEWRCNGEGMLLPHSYMDWSAVEALFKNPRVFIAFMAQKKDIEAAIDYECSSVATFRKLSETELRHEAKALCVKMWGLTALTKASLEQRMAVAQKLWGDRRTYSLSVLSRVTMVDKEALEAIFGKRS